MRGMPLAANAEQSVERGGNQKIRENKYLDTRAIRADALDYVGAFRRSR